MRMPLTRSWADEAPVAWWAWLFTPVVVAVPFLACWAAIPAVIPDRERRAFDWDIVGPRTAS